MTQKNKKSRQTDSNTKNNASQTHLNNSLYDVTQNIVNNGNIPSAQITQPDTLIYNNRYYPIAVNRTELSWAYFNHGILQTYIDKPIDDAFRSGIIIDSSQLDTKSIQILQNYLAKNDILEIIKKECKWSSLYGGGGMIIDIAGDDPSKPLDVNDINEDTEIDFYASDPWELFGVNPHQFAEKKPYIEDFDVTASFNFYGRELHPSRVILFNATQAPSLLRPILRGWGTSDLEKAIAPYNNYLKQRELLYSLSNKALNYVFKIEGYNASLSNPHASQNINFKTKMMFATQSAQNITLMDTKDEYQQVVANIPQFKDSWDAMREALAAELGFPEHIIFGDSPNNWGGGDNPLVLESYNGQVESRIRNKYNKQIIQMLQIICKKLFDTTVDDIQIRYHPLRVLSAEQEQNVKRSKFDMIADTYRMGWISKKTAIEQANLSNIFETEIAMKDILDEEIPPPPEQPTIRITDDVNQIDKQSQSNNLIKKFLRKNEYITTNFK